MHPKFSLLFLFFLENILLYTKMEYIDFDEAPEIDPDDEFLMEEEPDIPEMEEDGM